MRILLITYGLPWPPHSGGRIREYNIIKRLSEKHEVDLLSFVHTEQEWNTDCSELHKYCGIVKKVWVRDSIFLRIKRAILSVFLLMPSNCIKHMSRKFDNAFIELVTAGAYNYDAVQIEDLVLAFYYKIAKKYSNAHILLTLDNIESIRYRRLADQTKNLLRKALYSWQSLMYMRYERRIIKYFDILITVSLDGQKYARRMTSKPIIVVPNGVDMSQYRINSINYSHSDANLLLFTGLMNYVPNEDAMLYFCRDIFPLIRGNVPNAKLVIVGKDPTKQVTRLNDFDNVEVVGSVPETLPYFQKSSIFICPLRIGSGSRIKILEAMAMAKPVISTSIGCEGLEVANGQNIVIADDPDTFAKRTVELLKNNTLRNWLGKNGRRLVESKYDCKITLLPLENIYDKFPD